MVTNISNSAQETEALGELWGRAAKAGWIIGLTGDLGAGKTQLVKGLARGLGITERIHSPTFALVNEYWSGRLPLFHLDLYRLETRMEIASAGLEEYLNKSDGVTVIEWIEHWSDMTQHFGITADSVRLPINRLQSGLFLRWVQFETLGDNERRIIYEDVGP